MLPWHEVTALDGADFSQLRADVIFGGAKWDAQVGDDCTIARAPLVLRRSSWQALVELAERLAAELFEMERELLTRPELLGRLGLPRALLAHLPGPLPSRALRIHRFDFHFGDGGIRVSEVNADVPGGFHEATTASLYASRYQGTSVPGDAAARLAEAIAARVPTGAAVALVHATAYSDDRQVMSVLERTLANVGLRGVPCAPDHLRWSGGCRLALGPADDPVAAVVRFFPAEWLPSCPRDSQWPGLVRGPVLLCNPATTVAVQSKRLPLVWNRLRASSSSWRAVLPATAPVWSAPWWIGGRWVAKPALGRVGEGIVAAGVSRRADLARVALDAAIRPSSYVAQRRFTPLPWRAAHGVFFPCIGVFTLDGRAVGAYGRASRSLFVDHRAIDTPVLVADDGWQEKR
jgi:glutathionylspermidine synthase